MPVENAASSSIETRVAPDGIAYSWTEFENYFDADMAAEIWEAAQVVAPPEPAQTLTSPSFRLSSLPLLHASFFSDPMLLLLLLFLFIFIYSHCYMYTHSNFSIFVKQIMLRRSMWRWNRRPAQRPSRRASSRRGGYTWAEFSLSLPIFVILFLSSPLSVSCHSYHATYTYLITYDKQIQTFGAGN